MYRNNYLWKFSSSSQTLLTTVLVSCDYRCVEGGGFSEVILLVENFLGQVERGGWINRQISENRWPNRKYKHHVQMSVIKQIERNTINVSVEIKYYLKKNLIIFVSLLMLSFLFSESCYSKFAWKLMPTGILSVFFFFRDSSLIRVSYLYKY